MLKAVLKISQFNKGARLLDQHQYKKAFDYFDKILHQEPNNPLAWVGKAATLQKLGKTEEASKFTANALNPQLHKVLLAKNEIRALVFKTVGIIYTDLENYEKALEYTEKSLELNKASPYSLTNKGFILGKLGKIEGSLKCLNKALRYNPKSAPALINKSTIFRKLGKYEKAMENADRALEIDSTVPDYWLTKGKILMCLNSYENALNAFNEALKLDQEYEDSYQKTLECFNKILEKYPDHAEAWNTKGMILIKLKSCEKALKSFEMALKIENNNYDN